MTALRLLLTGLGLLFVGLLLSLDPLGASLQDPVLLGARVFFVQAATLVGSGLVVSAALVSALRPAPEPARAPDIDHYA